jgi:cell fate regulator YaaT (PSP1 superfamily)
MAIPRSTSPELTQSLEAHFGTRIELRRLGARDETKVMTGVGTCGRELCCSSWLDKFSNISIRMAKEQDLPLKPVEAHGVCGRLKCCLIYELETYQEVNGKLRRSATRSTSVVRQRLVRHVRAARRRRGRTS